MASGTGRNRPRSLSFIMVPAGYGQFVGRQTFGDIWTLKVGAVFARCDAAAQLQSWSTQQLFSMSGGPLQTSDRCAKAARPHLCALTVRPAFLHHGCCGPYGGVDSIAAEAAEGALVRDLSRTSSTSSSSTNVDNQGRLLRRLEVRGSRLCSNSATLPLSLPTTTC